MNIIKKIYVAFKLSFYIWLIFLMGNAFFSNYKKVKFIGKSSYKMATWGHVTAQDIYEKFKDNKEVLEKFAGIITDALTGKDILARIQKLTDEDKKQFSEAFNTPESILDALLKLSEETTNDIISKTEGVSTKDEFIKLFKTKDGIKKALKGMYKVLGEELTNFIKKLIKEQIDTIDGEKIISLLNGKGRELGQIWTKDMIGTGGEKVTALSYYNADLLLMYLLCALGSDGTTLTEKDSDGTETAVSATSRQFAAIIPDQCGPESIAKVAKGLFKFKSSCEELKSGICTSLSAEQRTAILVALLKSDNYQTLFEGIQNFSADQLYYTLYQICEKGQDDSKSSTIAGERSIDYLRKKLEKNNEKNYVKHTNINVKYKEESAPTSITSCTIKINALQDNTQLTDTAETTEETGGTRTVITRSGKIKKIYTVSFPTITIPKHVESSANIIAPKHTGTSKKIGAANAKTFEYISLEVPLEADEKDFVSTLTEIRLPVHYATTLGYAHFTPTLTEDKIICKIEVDEQNFSDVGNEQLEIFGASIITVGNEVTFSEVISDKFYPKENI